MDIEKLIEQLNDFNENHIAVLCGSGQCACGYLCDKDDCIVVRAATALSTLKGENAEMQKQLNEFSEFLCRMTGGLLSKTNYTAQEMATAAEDYQQKVCGECDLQAENEKLRAELERCKEKNAGLALALLTECAPNPDCLGDDEWRAIRAELEKVTRERDAAVKCIEEIEDALNFQRMSAIGLRISEWRGQKED